MNVSRRDQWSGLPTPTNKAINQYFEKNLTTGEETSYYYLGGRRIAFKKGVF